MNMDNPKKSMDLQSIESIDTRIIRRHDKEGNVDLYEEGILSHIQVHDELNCSMKMRTIRR